MICGRLEATGDQSNRAGMVAGLSCEQFEALLGQLWDHIGMILCSFWDYFGIALESCWDYFGIMLGSFRVILGSGRVFYSREVGLIRSNLHPLINHLPCWSGAFDFS